MVIYETMQDVRALREPLDMMKLFLEFYASLNPYAGSMNPTAKLDGYLRQEFRVTGASPHPESASLYKAGRIWDISGALSSVRIPVTLELDDNTIRSVFMETYGDSFKRPKPLLIVGAGDNASASPLVVDIREEMETLSGRDNEKYGLPKQLEFLARLLGREWTPEERGDLEEYVRQASRSNAAEVRAQEPAVVRDMFASRCMRQVYTFIGTSIFPRFLGVFQVGSLGSPEFETAPRNTGTDFGLFSYMVSDDMFSPCNMINVRGLGGDFSLADDEKKSVRAFLEQVVPEYMGRYGSTLDAVPDGMRYIDLSRHEAVSVGFYTGSLLLDALEDVALMVEVTRFSDLCVPGKDMQVRTNFLVMWLDPGEAARGMVKESCGVLSTMMLDQVWADRVASGARGGMRVRARRRPNPPKTRKGRKGARMRQGRRMTRKPRKLRTLGKKNPRKTR